MSMIYRPIGELCTRITSGGTPSRAKPEYFCTQQEGHRWVKSKELLDCVITDTEEHITDQGLQKSSAKYLPEQTILVAMYGANVGQLGWLRYPATVNQAICGLIVDPSKADYRYLYYALLATREALIAKAQGAAQQNLNQDSIKSFCVPTPELPTQRRIASILSAYDDLIENNTRRVAILEEMARRIYQEWFVHFRFPGHEQVKMVESELGLIPEGWSLCRLEDVCSRITDGSHSSPSSVDAGKPMASVKDMTDWGINTSSCRVISEEDYQKLVRSDCKPRLNDVLIAKDGSYLKHTFVVDDEIDLVILSSIAILRPNGRFLPNQLALYLRLPHIKERMKGYVSGVAIPRIILKDFRQFLVLVPPASLQRQWAERCDAMLSLCRMLVRKNANLRATRDLLLPKLISGDLDVSTMHEEPEETIAA